MYMYVYVYMYFHLGILFAAILLSYCSVFI